MSSPEERIKELARARAIDPASAEQLLEAVRPAPSKRPALRNPFDRWSGETTSLAGLVVAVVAACTSLLGARYDGAIDLHFGHAPVPLSHALLDQVNAVLVTAAVLWGAARFVSRARFVDVLGAVGLSRVGSVLVAAPLALLVARLPLQGLDPGKAASAIGAQAAGLLVAIAVLAVVGIGLHITLLVLGFRTATGARGGRLAVSFVAGLFAAEVVTKVVLFVVAIVSR